MTPRRISVLICLIVLSLAHAGFADNPDPQLQDILKDANEKLAQGKTRSALFEFQKAEKLANHDDVPTGELKKQLKALKAGGIAKQVE